MSFNNININVSGPVQPTSTYKTKVLKGNHSFASQITEPNMKYIIKHDFVLDGDVTIPANCVLEFDGGSVSGAYTIIGNKTKINSDVAYNIFHDVEVVGFKFPYIDVRWFGAISDYNEITKVGTDNTVAFTRAINCIGQYYKGLYIRLVGKYYIGTNINTPYDISIWGSHTPSRLDNESTDLTDNSSPSLIAVGNVTAFTMTGRDISGSAAKWAYLNIKNIKVVGTNTSSIFIRYEASGKPTRVSTISDCEFRHLSKVLYVYGTGDTVLGDLVIQSVLAYNNGKFIESDSTNNIRTICNLVIRDSNIEHNSKNTILLNRCFGPVLIDNCILEGQPNPIKLTIHNGSLSVTNCYFEGNEGSSQDNDNFTIYHSGTEQSLSKLKFTGCYSDTQNSVSIYSENDVLAVDFGNLSDSCAFKNCKVESDALTFNLSWIQPTSVISFTEVNYGDMIANINDADHLMNAIQDDMVGVHFTSEDTKALLYYADLVVDNYYYIAFYSNKDAFIYGGISNVSSGFPVKRGLNIIKLKYTSGDTVMIKASDIFISRPVLLDATAQFADIRVLDTSHRYIGNKGNLVNVSNLPKGFQIFDSSNKPLYWNGTVWVDATGTPV